MTALFINLFCMACMLGWSNYGVSGQFGHYLSDEILKQYLSLTMGLSSFIGGAVNDSSEEDLKELSMMLNHVAVMMQEIGDPYGAPTFADGRSFVETEEVFSKIAPYICLLPESTSKDITFGPALLGGIVGGLIGEKTAERLKRDRNFRDKVFFLTNAGIIAGAFGGKAGYQVLRGPFGKENNGLIAQIIPHLVSNMGDIYSIVSESFKPLSQPTYSYMKKNLEKSLYRSLHKMGRFIEKAAKTFHNSHKATKSNEFNMKFHHMDAQVSAAAKAVGAMAGVFGGVLGYVLPRPFEPGVFAHKPSLNEKDPTKHASLTRSLRFSQIPTKSSFNGRNTGKEFDLNDESLADLAQLAGLIGGYSGIIGGMMGNVLANGVSIQAGKLPMLVVSQHWNSGSSTYPRTSSEHQEFIREKQNEPLLTPQMFKRRLLASVTTSGYRRLPSDSEICFEHVVSGIMQFEKMNILGDMIFPGSLNFQGPFGRRGDKVDHFGLQRVLLGAQWNNGWDKGTRNIAFKHGERPSAFLSVIDAASLHDNVLVYWVNKEKQNSKLMRFLKSKISLADLSETDKQNASIHLWVLLKPSLIRSISGDDIAKIFIHPSSALNPERLSQFLKSVSDQQMNSALEVIEKHMSEKRWLITQDVAKVVSSDIIRRFGQGGFAKLCQFAIGVSPDLIKRMNIDLLIKDANLIICFEAVKDDLTTDQIQAIVLKVLRSSNLTIEKFQNAKSFAGEFDSLLWAVLNSSQIQAVIGSGVFIGTKDVCLKKKKSIIKTILPVLISNINGSAKHLRKLGSFICGIPAADLKLYVPYVDLQEVRSNWSKFCIEKATEIYLKSVKVCSIRHSVDKKGLCHKFSERERRKQAVDNYVSTREAVRNFSSADETLPLEMVAGIDGLKPSEIARIPDELLLRSIHLINNNPRLSSEQMRIILHKILQAGYSITTVDAMKDLGLLLSQINVSSVTAQHAEIVLRERPDILHRFSTANLVSLFEKLKVDVGNSNLFSSALGLSSLISADIIHSTAHLNMEVVAKARWSRQQGIAIIQKYKKEHKKDALSLMDVWTLGKAVIGLICDDITNFPLFAMVDVAHQIDDVIGNDIPADLAECLATKIYLCFKMKCNKGGVNIGEAVGRFLPGNILLFMPSTVLLSVAYGSHCSEMIKRIGKANQDLLPVGTGQITLQAVIEASHICFGFMKSPYLHDSAQNTASSDYSHINEGLGSVDTDSAWAGNTMLSQNEDNVMYSYIGEKSIQNLGKLACLVKAYDISKDLEIDFELDDDLIKCMKQLNPERKEEISAMVQSMIFDLNHRNDTNIHVLLSSLGPMLPYLKPDFLTYSLSDEEVAMMMETADLKEMFKKLSLLDGDKSTPSINFGEIFSLSFPEVSANMNLSNIPIDIHAFADAVFPKLYNYVYMKVNESGTRTRRSTWKDKVHYDADETVMQEGVWPFHRVRRQSEENVTIASNKETLSVNTTVSEFVATSSSTTTVISNGTNYTTTTISTAINYTTTVFNNTELQSNSTTTIVKVGNSTSSAYVSPSSSTSNNKTNENGSIALDDFNEEDTDARVMYEVVLRAGPAIVGISNYQLQQMSNNLLRNTFTLLGHHGSWRKEQLHIIKSRISSLFGNVSSWSSEVLQGLGHLSTMLDVKDINQLRNVDLKVLSSFSTLKWPSDDHRHTLLYKYMSLKSKNVGQLQGNELVAMGDLLCGINVGDIPKLDSSAIRFAFASLGKRKCFKDIQRLSLKTKVLEAINAPINHPAVVSQLGILAGSLNSSEMKLISPQLASLVHPDAFRLIPPTSILNGWKPSHFALMGTKNGAVLFTRPNIFGKLDSRSKNAVFRAAFGNNAGLLASQIYLLKHRNKKLKKAFDRSFTNMLASIRMFFNKMYPPDNTHSRFPFGPNSVFGVDDPRFFTPPPPSLAVGLSRSDFANTFGDDFLENNNVISFINKASSSSHQSIFDVLLGSKSLNDLNERDIQTMPASVLEGMKPSQIRGMSPSTITSLFDSKVCSRNAASMTRVVHKMDLSQFEEALGLMNKKAESADTLTPWRPLITTQEVIVRDYLKRLTSSDLSDTDKIEKFLENMCPFAAGIPSYMIKRIPMVDEKKSELLDCLAESYPDMSMTLKKQIAKWSIQGFKYNEPIDLTVLGPFILDVPRYRVQYSLTNKMILSIINFGILEKLDILHPNYKPLVKLFFRKLADSNPEQFDDTKFLEKLGPSQCDIPLRKVKSSMSKASFQQLALYTMQNCKSKEELLEESLDQCADEQALRLQRCQILQHEKSMAKPAHGISSFRKPKIDFRVGLDQFKMLHELKETLFENDDLAHISGQKMKEKAGAIGGLTPYEMDQLPDSSVLDAMETIKDNKNLSPKQKRIMFGKCRNAGFSLESPTSLTELGELMTAVPAEDLMKISPENIVNSMKDLRKNANAFSPSQTRAIVTKLQEVDMDDILADDLGDFAAKISLNKLDTMENINISLVKDQKWARHQALKLLDMYRNSTEDFVINSDLIGELGATVVGLKCSDIMELKYYDAIEAVTAIDAQGDVDPDIDECIQRFLDFAMKVEMGVDYMENDTSEMQQFLESLPEDVAMFYAPEILNETSDEFCDIIFEKIGRAQLNGFPPGIGDARRVRLAKGAMECLKRSSNHDFNVLEEDDVLMLGNLICDVPSENYQGMTADALDAALDFMKECMYRFTINHVNELQNVIHTHLGEGSSWDESTVAALGPLFCMMKASDILETNNVYFAEAYDEIIPPKIDSTLASHYLINNDIFYDKAKEALVFSGVENRRKRRQNEVHSPTFIEINALGAGNIKWTPEELSKISNEVIIAVVNVLGTVEDWSSEQTNVLLQRIEEALEKTIDKWSTTNVADAKHILKNLPTVKISQLDISTLDTASSLSDIAWNKNQQAEALDVYLKKNTKTPATLTPQDVAGLGNLFCGLSESKMFMIPPNVFSNALNDIGELKCYDRNQLDTLFTLALQSNGGESPDAAQLTEMGSIAAGMTTSDLEAIPVASMSSLSVAAIELMEPVRFQDAMSVEHLTAAGVTNIAAIIATKSLYNALTVVQRNALQTAAYGPNAVLEEGDAGEENSDSNDSGSGGISNQNTNDVGTSEGSIEVELFAPDDEDFPSATATSGTSQSNPQFCVGISVLSFVYLFLKSLALSEGFNNLT